MRRRVSPLFGTIVILAALVVAGLYFMVRYRAHDAHEAALRDEAQAQMEAMRSSGRYMSRTYMSRMRMSARRGARTGTPEAPGAEQSGGPATPDERPSSGAADQQ